MQRAQFSMSSALWALGYLSMVAASPPKLQVLPLSFPQPKVKSSEIAKFGQTLQSGARGQVLPQTTWTQITTSAW